MSTFPLRISSPDGDLYRGDAEMLILRGTEGDLAIMAGHIPFVTAVVHGNCVIIAAEGERKEGVIEEGLLTVDKDQVTVLTSALTLNNA
ncbi:MAG: F0F1 ATP synthase subunit epsilon [Clostridia bacterium]|nr:F0F1 ATP synthase subunit epsilon [Clostridia bacterium]